MKRRKVHSDRMSALLLAIVASSIVCSRAHAQSGEARDISPKPAFAKRCGWFENPTPSNAWLTDRDGSWVISTQGEGGAEGDWPEFAPDQWVETNVHYGYGCACLTMLVHRNEKKVLSIRSVKALPLSVCRGDKTLPKEPRP